MPTPHKGPSSVSVWRAEVWNLDSLGVLAVERFFRNRVRNSISAIRSISLAACVPQLFTSQFTFRNSKFPSSRFPVSPFLRFASSRVLQFAIRNSKSLPSLFRFFLFTFSICNLQFPNSQSAIRNRSPLRFPGSPILRFPVSPTLPSPFTPPVSFAGAPPRPRLEEPAFGISEYRYLALSGTRYRFNCYARVSPSS